MKKSLLTLFVAFASLCAMAQSVKNYSETYVISVNEELQGEPKNVDLVVEENDTDPATINFEFKNLVVSMNNSEVSLGDIRLENIEVVEMDGEKYFEQEGTYTIPATSLPSNLQMMASFFENLPYYFGGKYSDEKFFGVLEIEVTMLQQTIDVVIGDPGVSDLEAISYTEDLYVTINGTTLEPQPTTVTVYNNGDGTINFELKNFVLSQGGMEMGVGNIAIDNLPITEGTDGLQHFSYDGVITIPAGDKEGVDYWLGPDLHEVPLKLQGKLNMEKLFVTIDIDMMNTQFKQMINVQLGSDDFVTRQGTVYSEPLVVTINGNSLAPQQTDVTVYENSDETIDFELKNFVLSQGGMEIGVGNINLTNLPVTQGTDGLQYFSYDGIITIPAGDKEGVDYWLGPDLHEVPLKLEGKMNESKLFVVIDIDMMNTQFKQMINVKLGTDDFVAKPEKIFNEQYVVTVNDEKQEPQTADIKVVDNGDGTINFVLPDFVLHNQMGDFPIGDITLENVPVEEGEDGFTSFDHQGTFSVPDEKIPEMLSGMASTFKNIPYTLSGKYNDEKLYANININILTFAILVEVGTDSSTGLKGDIDGNGRVNLTDALIILDKMAEGNNDPMYDVNGDGKVNLTDFLTILSIMAEQ